MIINQKINLKVSDDFIKILPKVEDKKVKKLWGLTRALISNMVIGVTLKFHKELSILGVGYKVYLKKKKSNTISINISNISSIEEYNLVFQELENIIFFDNLSLSSLTNDDVIFSSNLLGKVSDIEKIFRTKKNFKINSINYKKISIEFNPLKDA
jgi:hypothetical protein